MLKQLKPASTDMPTGRPKKIKEESGSGPPGTKRVKLQIAPPVLPAWQCDNVQQILATQKNAYRIGKHKVAYSHPDDDTCIVIRCFDESGSSGVKNAVGLRDVDCCANVLTAMLSLLYSEKAALASLPTVPFEMEKVWDIIEKMYQQYALAPREVRTVEFKGKLTKTLRVEPFPLSPGSKHVEVALPIGEKYAHLCLCNIDGRRKNGVYLFLGEALVLIRYLNHRFGIFKDYFTEEDVTATMKNSDSFF